MNPYAVQLSLFFAALLVMGVWETLLPARKWKQRRTSRWLFHGGVSILNTLVTRLLVAVPFYHLIRHVVSEGWGLMPFLGIQGITEVMLSIFFYDGFNYFWHRINHRVKFFWRFHSVHHLDTHLDVTTALRFHPVEYLLSYGAKALWILFWGPSLWAFLMTEAAITVYAAFHHANIDFPDSVEKQIRRVHMTPRLHAGHHTVTRRTRDANFSTIFLLWDRLFGTLEEPDREELVSLGLPYGRERILEPAAFLKAPFLRP